MVPLRPAGEYFGLGLQLVSVVELLLPGVHVGTAQRAELRQPVIHSGHVGCQARRF